MFENNEKELTFGNSRYDLLFDLSGPSEDSGASQDVEQREEDLLFGIGYLKYGMRMEIAGHLLAHNIETLEKFEQAPAK